MTYLTHAMAGMERTWTPSVIPAACRGRRCRDSARLLRTTGTGRTRDRPTRDKPIAVRRLPRAAVAGAEHARSIGASEETVNRRLETHRRRGALTGKLPPARHPAAAAGTRHSTLPHTARPVRRDVTAWRQRWTARTGRRRRPAGCRIPRQLRRARTPRSPEAGTATRWWNGLVAVT